MKIGEENIESLFMSMMLKIHIYLKYINPKNNTTLLWNGLNKSNLKLSKWWLQLIGSQVVLSKPSSICI